MVRRRNRITFRLNDDQVARFKACIIGYRNGRSIWTWTELVIAALEDFWKSLGSPCPTPATASDTAIEDPPLFEEAAAIAAAAPKARVRQTGRRRAAPGARKAARISKRKQRG